MFEAVGRVVLALRPIGAFLLNTLFSISLSTPLGLVDFNNDGLASKYWRQHRVINVRASGFSEENRSRIDMEWWINIHQVYPD